MKRADLIKNFYICLNYIKSLDTMWKAFFGVIFGLFLFLIILLAFHRPLVNRYFLDISQEKATIASNQLFINNMNQDSVVEMKAQPPNIDEKLNSVNKRFDDFFIMAGIIITLLLAINIGIYINAGSKVDQYFKDHYDEHEKKVKKYSDNAETAYNEFMSQIKLKTKGLKESGKDQELIGE